MKITSVNVRKIEKEGSRMKGIASIVLDDSFGKITHFLETALDTDLCDFVICSHKIGFQLCDCCFKSVYVSVYFSVGYFHYVNRTVDCRDLLGNGVDFFSSSVNFVVYKAFACIAYEANNHTNGKQRGNNWQYN